MKLSIALLLLLIVSIGAVAADADAPKYAPAIFGRLTIDHQAMTSNVCLRRAGSEIRQCAYTDSDGRFYIPSLGAALPERAPAAGNRVGAYPVHWLELGTQAKGAIKLSPIELTDSKTAVIRLDCDVAQSAGHVDDKVGHCEAAADRSNVSTQMRR